MRGPRRGVRPNYGLRIRIRHRSCVTTIVYTVPPLRAPGVLRSATLICPHPHTRKRHNLPPFYLLTLHNHIEIHSSLLSPRPVGDPRSGTIARSLPDARRASAGRIFSSTRVRRRQSSHRANCLSDW